MSRIARKQKRIPQKSARKKAIDLAKAEIKKILYIKYGYKCFFCGKPEEHFKYPLSLFHILSVGAHPGLELTIENLLLCCWSKWPYKCCHNLWEDRVEPHRTNMENKIKEVFGQDFFDKLLVMEKVSPKLNEFRAMTMYHYYEMEAKNLLHQSIPQRINE